LAASGDRYGAVRGAVTYEDGSVRFDPADPSDAEDIPASVALADYKKTGLYAGAAKYSTPTVELADFTDFGSGTASTDGTLIPAHKSERSWVITYTGVPDVGSGGGVVAGGQLPSPATEIHNVMAIVDASDGTVIEVFSAVPDETPMPAPSPSAAKDG
jgi:hypothetical protein